MELLCSCGFFLFAFASFYSGSLSLDFAGDQFIAIQIFRAFGRPMVLVPMPYPIAVISSRRPRAPCPCSALALPARCRARPGARARRTLATPRGVQWC